MKIGTEIKLIKDVYRMPGMVDAPAGIRGVIIAIDESGDMPFLAVLDLRPAKLEWSDMHKKIATGRGITLPPYRRVESRWLERAQFEADEGHGFDQYFHDAVRDLAEKHAKD